MQMMQSGPARRTLVGTMLRRYREDRGFDLGEAASILDCDRSKISRIETGDRGIRAEDLRKLLGEYGVATAAQETLAAICHPHNDQGWWQHYCQVLPAQHLDFIITEGAASQIQIYAPTRVPELLATPEYVRAVAGADPAVPEGLEDVRVQAATSRRQALMFDRKPQVTVILGEAALRQQVGGQAVMRQQLAHLEALGQTHAWLTVRILPFSTGAHAGSDSGAFSLLRFDAMPDVGIAHLVGPAGGVYLDDAAIIAACADTFARLSRCAATPARSLARLRQLAAQ